MLRTDKSRGVDDPAAGMHPELVAALVVVYFDHGRWDIRRGGLDGEFEVQEPWSFALHASAPADSTEELQPN